MTQNVTMQGKSGHFEGAMQGRIAQRRALHRRLAQSRRARRRNRRIAATLAAAACLTIGAWAARADEPAPPTINECRALLADPSVPRDDPRLAACQWAAERCYVDGIGCDKEETER